MHRIDGPGATVDNLFTEGDPVGGVEATTVTDDWLNDVQENVVEVILAAGIALVKGDSTQLLNAIRSASGGVVGSARNLKMSVTAASATATVTADEVVLKSALGSKVRILGAFSQSINLATTGIGGMLSGSAPVSGYVAIYGAVKDDGTRGVFAINATSSASPEIAAAAPAGYTYTALLTVVATNASSQFLPVYVSGRDVWISPIQIYSSATQQGTLTLRDASAALPANAKTADVSTIVSSSSADVTIQSTIAGSNAAAGGLGQKINAITSPTAGAGLQSQFPNTPIITPQTIYYSVTIGGGTLTFSISVNGYSI